MDQAGVNAHVARGLAKAATVLGASFTQYRPIGPFDPLLNGSVLGTLSCAVDHDGALKFGSPVPPEKPFALLLANPVGLNPGDYLVGTDTYFVSRKLPFQPAWCVLCNGTFNVLDTAQATSAGANSYGGVTSGTNTLLARGWPMSKLSKLRSEQSTTKLPTDTRSTLFEVLMPNIPSLSLTTGLCLQDETLQTYQLLSYETTDYGSKLLVALETT